LVAKYKDEAPKTSNYELKDYNEYNLIEDMNFEIDIPQRISLGVIKNFVYSWNRCYKKISKQPKFHKYIKNKQSFYISSMIYKIKKENNFINLPHLRNMKGISKKIKLKTNFDKNINIQNIYFSYQNGKWYISGCYKKEFPDKRQNLEILGLDWGIKNFMTTSTGEIINYPKSVLREFQRISKLQKVRDKKIFNSNNYNKIRKKINNAYERMKNIKRNFVEQKTTELCKNYNIAIENLTNHKIKHLYKKWRRNQQIAPLYMFEEKLGWKCKKFGSTFYKTEPNNTSRMCSNCGSIKENLTLNDRIYYCEKCGLTIDRDVNAAINIAHKAICCSH
jgi:putative transposase